MIIAAQTPERGALNVDHVAHFVPDMDAASAALERLGFTVTPFSAQSHRLQADGPLVPAGTGNRCVMLERGYLEFLTPTADTPVAAQLKSAIARYVGVHLIAFGTGDAALDHARLARESFAPLAPVALERPISTESGAGTARFTVVRVPPGTMPEGRIQYCQQHTPELLWQPRWIAHANGTRALAGVLVCVGDVGEAASRFARFTGLPVEAEGSARVLRTSRGSVVFTDAAWASDALGVAPPSLPWIAGYALEAMDVEATAEYLRGRGWSLTGHGRGYALELPGALGGVLVLQSPGEAAFRATR